MVDEHEIEARLGKSVLALQPVKGAPATAGMTEADAKAKKIWQKWKERKLL